LTIAKSVRALTCHCNVQKYDVIDRRIHRLNLRPYDISPSSHCLSQSPPCQSLMFQVSRFLTLRLAADLDRNHATRCQPCSS
ncbi:hypothetical protein P692DRAFT_20750974, partial [Suillus brevipes Sb2]